MLLAVSIPIAVLVARRATPLAPVKAFLLPLMGPILIVVWSGLFWAAEERSHPNRIHWVSWMLYALLAGGLIALACTLVLYRRSPRVWIVVLSVVANLMFLLTASLVGVMAISNTWL
jgi:hypothetical protein